MAGVIIFVGGANAQESLRTIVRTGTYATILREPVSGHWWESWEGTWADYAACKPGDSVFFFCQRKVYGVGRLVAIGDDCKYSAFEGASRPVSYSYGAIQDTLLVDVGPGSEQQRWLITFEPDPAFFTQGVDIDDVLASRPAAFKAFRAMDNVTFGRMGDIEEQAFRDAILRANEEAIAGAAPPSSLFEDNHSATHEEIRARITPSHALDGTPLLRFANSNGKLRHEMALEAGLMAQLSAGEPGTTEVFGSWDYVSHQVLASPFKPLKWADRMDVFGYRYMPRYRPTIDRFLVAELKRDVATLDDVDQCMKYVDWVKDEYADGNYALVRAFLVAHSFDASAAAQAIGQATQRIYTLGRRPAVVRTWKEIELVSYRFDERLGLIVFSPLR